MDTMDNKCKNCGAPLQQGSSVCASCGTPVAAMPPAGNEAAPRVNVPGAAAPAAYVPPPPAPPVQSAAQPPAYTPAPPAPAAPQQGGPQFYSPPSPAPSSPAAPQFGAPNAQQGYGFQPPQGQPPQGQQPYPQQYPTGYTAPAPGKGGPSPKKKKSKTGMIIGICSGVAVIAIIAVVLIAFVMPKQELQNEYDSLVDSICGSSTPAQVVRYADQLATFDAENPGMVDGDLNDLVDACDEYENAEEDEFKYTDAISALEKSEKSSNTSVASCATKLLKDVESEYDDFQEMSVASSSVAAPEPPPSSSGTEPAPPSSSGTTASGDPMEVLNDGMAILEYDGTDHLLSMEAKNNSGQEIVYFEVVFYFFNANAEPVNGPDGKNYTVLLDNDISLPAGATHTPEQNGYWSMNDRGFDNNQITMAVPFISYVEFADGTSWGNYDSGSNSALQRQMEEWSYLAELIAILNM